MSKPIFTVTEVKDWINGVIAIRNGWIKRINPEWHGESEYKSMVSETNRSIEMLEYIRDNYFSAELLNCILDILNDVLDGEITKEDFDDFMERGTK